MKRLLLLAVLAGLFGLGISGLQAAKQPVSGGLPDPELLCPLRINVAEVSRRPASTLRLLLLEKRSNP